jgi:hypothetical protein
MMSVSPSADDRFCGLFTLVDELTARNTPGGGFVWPAAGFVWRDVDPLAALVGLIRAPQARAEFLEEAAGEVSSAQVGAFCALLCALGRRGDALIVLGALRRLGHRVTAGGRHGKRLSGVSALWVGRSSAFLGDLCPFRGVVKWGLREAELAEVAEERWGALRVSGHEHPFVEVPGKNRSGGEFPITVIKLWNGMFVSAPSASLIGHGADRVAAPSA